jgi:hypothetical protein
MNRQAEPGERKKKARERKELRGYKSILRNWQSLNLSSISSPLWHPYVQCRVYKRPPLVPTLSQMNPVHALATYVLNTHFNTILPSMPRSSKRSLSFRFFATLTEGKHLESYRETRKRGEKERKTVQREYSNKQNKKDNKKLFVNLTIMFNNTTSGILSIRRPR